MAEIELFHYRPWQHADGFEDLATRNDGMGFLRGDIQGRNRQSRPMGDCLGDVGPVAETVSLIILACPSSTMCSQRLGPRAFEIIRETVSAAFGRTWRSRGGEERLSQSRQGTGCSVGVGSMAMRDTP